MADMSMAAGEYVSVHSQADAEHADLERERAELKADRGAEQGELTAIYEGRGLDAALARQVAAQVGGANSLRGAARVTFWGALAMGMTTGLGALFGTVV